MAAITGGGVLLCVVCSYGNGLIPCKSGSGVNPTGLFDSSIFLNVIDILKTEPGNTKKKKNRMSKRTPNIYANVTKQFIKDQIGYLFMGTAGTQCLATSAPFPFSTRTDLRAKKNKNRKTWKYQRDVSNLCYKSFTRQEVVKSKNQRIHQVLRF